MRQSFDSSELCRFYLAALQIRGFDIKAIARGLRFNRRELGRIWLGTDYTPLSADALSELGRFIERNPELPASRDLLEEGKALAERMGPETWGDPEARNRWIVENLKQ